MLNQDTSIDIKPKTSTGHLGSLNDHDYCTSLGSQPVKKEENISNCNNKTQLSCTSSNNNNNNNNNNINNRSKQTPTTMDHELLASKSTTTNSKPNHSLAGYNNLKLRRTNSDDNLSDSSSAISSSSDSERGGLVIAQDRGSKPQAPNTTSTGQKRQRGRPPKRETDTSKQTMPTQARAKRPRQNVSVTDKSEWITGEEQIDSILSEQVDDEPLKRKRVISRDSDHLYEEDLSSDYSSSDAEQDDDSEEDEESEDDPNALWCVCRRPYDNKFMICCDVCKDWFHGDCVNVTKLMGDRIEREKREWFCQECKDKMKSGIPRDAIPQKIVKKEKQKKKKHPKPGKRGRGRPRKSESGVREISTRSSARNSRKSLDSKLSIDNGRLMRRGSARPEARIETFDEFEDSQRLKVLIKERKKEFFYKRQLAEQQKAVKRNELGLGKRAITADLGESLDSLASNTNTPNMNNLPINIKSDHHGKEHRHKPPIVIQINTKKEPGSDPSTPKIVTAIVKPPKKLNTPDVSHSSLNDLFTAEPIQISKKQKISDDGHHQSSSDLCSHASPDKRTHSTSSASFKTIDKSSGAADHVTYRKKRKDSESSVSNGSNPAGSKLIRQKIKETLIARSKQIKDIDNVSDEKIDTLSIEIENQLNECFKEGTQKYLNKFRSLMFNLRDPKNQCLVTNVLSGDITPSRLVRMSPDEMASNELAKWRERENKHSIELIKRDAQLAAQQVIVKKTHKGEEVISAPSLDDSTNSETSVQDPPTTPTKSPKDLFKTKLILDDSGSMSTSPTTAKLAKSVPEIISPTDHLVISPESTKTIKPDEMIKSSPTKNLDKTEDIQDLGSISGQQKTVDLNEKEPTQDAPAQGPKRFSVTIQSSLNPSDLSRLREPLVKPLERSSTDETNDNDSTTPSEHQTPDASRVGDDHDEDERKDQDASVDDDDHGDDEVDDLEYDPEALPPGLGGLNKSCTLASEIAPPGLCLVNQAAPSAEAGDTKRKRVKDIWSGTITMPDIAKFKSIARVIDGDGKFMSDDVKPELTVCGRIAPDQMHGYIKKLRTTTKNQILIIQLFPQESEDKASFNSFFDYLYSRNRYGVVQTNPQILKDFYILPLHERSCIPEVLKPLKNSSLDRRNNPNCLIGMLVRSKR